MRLRFVASLLPDHGEQAHTSRIEHQSKLQYIMMLRIAATALQIARVGEVTRFPCPAL